MKNNRVEQVNYIFLITVLTYLAGSYVLAYVAATMKLKIPTFVSLLYSQVILILPAVVFIRRNQIKLVEFIRVKKVNLVTVVLLVLLGIMIRPAMSFLSAVSMLWAKNEISDTANQLINEVSFGLALVFMAVIPAVLEEFVYRGVFYNEYRKANTGKAILISGLLFGLMHMNLNQFIYAFFMGVIFALIIEATDSILASMIVHFTINGSSLLLLKLTPLLAKQLGEDGEAALLDSAMTTRQDVLNMLPALVVPAIMSLLISMLIYYGIVKINKRTSDITTLFKESISEERRRMLTVPLLGGMAICILCMVLNILA